MLVTWMAPSGVRNKRHHGQVEAPSDGHSHGLIIWQTIFYLLEKQKIKFWVQLSYIYSLAT